MEVQGSVLDEIDEQSSVAESYEMSHAPSKFSLEPSHVSSSALSEPSNASISSAKESKPDEESEAVASISKSLSS